MPSSRFTGKRLDVSLENFPDIPTLTREEYEEHLNDCQPIHNEHKVENRTDKLFAIGSLSSEEIMDICQANRDNPILCKLLWALSFQKQLLELSHYTYICTQRLMSIVNYDDGEAEDRKETVNKEKAELVRAMQLDLVQNANSSGVIQETIQEAIQALLKEGDRKIVWPFKFTGSSRDPDPGWTIDDL